MVSKNEEKNPNKILVLIYIYFLKSINTSLTQSNEYITGCKLEGLALDHSIFTDLKHKI